MLPMRKPACLLLLFLLPLAADAAKVAEVKVLDRDTIMVRVLDGEVEFVEDMSKIRNPYGNNDSSSGQLDIVTRHDPALDTGAAQTAANWRVRSLDDDDYGLDGRLVTAVHRKTKLNGMAVREWITANADFRYEVTFEHRLFLRLPLPMKQGARYMIEAAPATNVDQTALNLTFDIFHSRSEAVRVNLAGYLAGPGIKAADLYEWMGDGGARDYAAFEGNKVHLYDVETGATHEVGSVTFWRNQGNGPGGWNYTRSPVWNIDFTGFTTPGTYRLVVEGVGCSEDFVISPLPRKVPFDVAVQGYFFMRVGQPRVDGIAPVPRQPLYIPGQDPANTVVYLTSMNPFHPQWNSFVGGTSGTPARPGTPSSSRVHRPIPTPAGATPTRSTGTATSPTSRTSMTSSCPTSSPAGSSTTTTRASPRAATASPTSSTRDAGAWTSSSASRPPTATATA
jgi:endoglucanase